MSDKLEETIQLFRGLMQKDYERVRECIERFIQESHHVFSMDIETILKQLSVDKNLSEDLIEVIKHIIKDKDLKVSLDESVEWLKDLIVILAEVQGAEAFDYSKDLERRRHELQVVYYKSYSIRNHILRNKKDYSFVINHKAELLESQITLHFREMIERLPHPSQRQPWLEQFRASMKLFREQSSVLHELSRILFDMKSLFEIFEKYEHLLDLLEKYWDLIEEFEKYLARLKELKWNDIDF
jgi:hypothetical protein